MMLYITEHYLPFLGSVIGTYMLFRLAFVEKKLRTNPAVIIAGMLLEAVAIAMAVYTTITNPDTTQAIVGWTGASIALGLLSPYIVTAIEKAVQRQE
ncbi:MAG TPA: iron chelate uptake ABC transporter family permease subunit [Ktedonobacterales bacterium]|nr:iron chelate uptake ABC transporter family permease subunit [Ktedonobacterales bacterium]